MAHWSHDYNSFEEVEPPYPAQWRHPSLRKEWWDYQCNLVKSFTDELAEILHNYGCGNVGTDMMAQNYLDYYAVNEKLDGVQAEIVLPNEQPITVTGGKYEYEREWEDLDGEPFTPESFVTEVFDNPKAVKAFNEVFCGIFTGSEHG